MNSWILHVAYSVRRDSSGAHYVATCYSKRPSDSAYTGRSNGRGDSAKEAMAMAVKEEQNTFARLSSSVPSRVKDYGCKSEIDRANGYFIRDSIGEEQTA